MPTTTKIDAKERLIVALDVPDVAAARKMVDELEGVADFFKIGLTLQLAEGVEELIHSLIARGKRVFLDYKYYDISETAEKSGRARGEVGRGFFDDSWIERAHQGGGRGARG